MKIKIKKKKKKRRDEIEITNELMNKDLDMEPQGYNDPETSGTHFDRKQAIG